MAGSVANFTDTGNAGFPSPSIWADCQGSDINDLGLGVYVRKHWHGDEQTLPDLLNGGDSPTFAYDATNGNRVMRTTTGTTDNNGAYYSTRPLGTITKNSGQPVWFEVDVALGALVDQGIFVGLVELAGATHDVVADDAGGLIGESLAGFQILADDTDAADAVYQKDADGVVEVLADATNATAIPTDERSALVANTFVKFGLRFDGREKLRWYVNGYEVAALEIDSTFDQAKEYSGIVAIKTGAAAGRILDSRFFSHAVQERY